MALMAMGNNEDNADHLLAVRARSGERVFGIRHALHSSGTRHPRQLLGGAHASNEPAPEENRMEARLQARRSWQRSAAACCSRTGRAPARRRCATSAAPSPAGPEVRARNRTEAEEQLGEPVVRYSRRRCRQSIDVNSAKRVADNVAEPMGVCRWVLLNGGRPSSGARDSDHHLIAIHRGSLSSSARTARSGLAAAVATASSSLRTDATREVRSERVRASSS